MSGGDPFGGPRWEDEVSDVLYGDAGSDHSGAQSDDADGEQSAREGRS